MALHIAFLRGINVGGDTVLPMAELRSVCEDLGYKNVRTYIQSGNVLFGSELSEERLVRELEAALQARQQKHIPVIIRSAQELRAILAHNPFPDANPSRVGVLLFGHPLPKDLFAGVTIPPPEEVVLSGRELYIHYPNGMGRSRLKLPELSHPGTMRNINTITKLVNLSQDHEIS